MGEPQTRTIDLDGRRYVIAYAPASAALTAAAIYANSFAPMIDAAARRIGQPVAAKRLAGIAEMIGQPGLASQVKALCYIFAEYTQVVEGDGRSFSLASREKENGPLNTAVFDRVFAGGIASLWKWLQAAVEHNLEDFLAEFRERLAEEAPDVFTSKSPVTSPTTG